MVEKTFHKPHCLYSCLPGCLFLRKSILERDYPLSSGLLHYPKSKDFSDYVHQSEQPPFYFYLPLDVKGN